MQLLDNIIILLLPVISFVMGKRVADKYKQEQIDMLTDEIKRLSFMNGVGYLSQPQPVKKYVPIGQPFLDKLRDNGRAVQKLDRKP